MNWYAAPGKLNLFLHVLGRRADGYHLLQTVFRLIDRCDRVGIATRADGEIRRHEGGPGAFIVVPRGTAHREGSASPTGVDVVLVRIGRGQVVFPVEGLPEGD